MCEAIDMVVFIATLFTEITTGKDQPQILPLVCITDCKSLFEAVYSSKYVAPYRIKWNQRTYREWTNPQYRMVGNKETIG